jgi:hypothetical protein
MTTEISPERTGPKFESARSFFSRMMERIQQSEGAIAPGTHASMVGAFIPTTSLTIEECIIEERDGILGLVFLTSEGITLRLTEEAVTGELEWSYFCTTTDGVSDDPEPCTVTLTPRALQ